MRIRLRIGIRIGIQVKVRERDKDSGTREMVRGWNKGKGSWMEYMDYYLYLW